MPLAQKSGKRFTYADYVTWPDDERWEIIDGRAYNMAPAPTASHQNIVYNLLGGLPWRPGEAWGRTKATG